MLSQNHVALFSSLRGRADAYLLSCGGVVSVQSTPPSGASLQQYLEQLVPLSSEQALDLLALLCDALEQTHASRLIHRQLSPERLYYTEGRLFIGGWERSDYTDAETDAPFYPYASPEALRKERLDERSDLFSVGAILYQCVTLKRPFSGASSLALLRSILTGAQPIQELRPDCPELLAGLCGRLLSIKREERPPSARSALDVLHPQPKTMLAFVDTLQGPALEGTGKATANSFAKTPASGAAPDVGPAPLDDTVAPNETPTPRLTSTRGPATERELEATPSEERYEMQGEFARGGLGKISKAFDQHMKRQVAVKELFRISGEAEQRFLREAWITAKLEHPAIVPVHDLGRWKNGAVYYTMKLINGDSFYKIISETRTFEERLSLLPHAIDVCEALAYAHSRRIIHRDLKPHNVLIGPFGETVVIDWGLAKELDEKNPPYEAVREEPYREEESISLTKTGAVMGTPAYMPVEQAKGAPVDERADVYSLGAILYHLFSGAPPYTETKSLRVLAKLLDEPPPPIEQREPKLPKDLADIIKKAMAREAQHRYPTAKELADDLNLFQTGQAVGAHQYTSAELLRRFLQKHKNAFRVAAALLVVLIAVISFAYLRLLQENAFANAGWESARKNAQAEKLAKEEEQRAKLRAEEEQAKQLKISQERTFEVIQNTIERDPTGALQLLQELTQYPDFKDPNYPGWGRVRTLAAKALSVGVPRVLGPEEHPFLSAELSPKGETIAAANQDSIYLWDTRSWSSQKLDGHTNISQVTFSPDGGQLVSFSYSDKSVMVWDLSTQKGTLLERREGKILAVRFSPDGKLLAVVGEDTLRLWDLSTGAYQEFAPAAPFNFARSYTLTSPPNPASILCFSSSGQRLAVSTANGVIIWDLAAGKERRFTHDFKRLTTLSFSADEASLFAGGINGSADLVRWEIKSGRATKLLEGVGAIHSEALSSQGFLAVGSGSGKIYLWKNEQQQKPLEDREGVIERLSYSADGGFLATSSSDHEINLWNLKTNTKHTLRAHQKAINSLLFSADNKQLISASDDGTVRVWELEQIEGKTFYLSTAPLIEPNKTTWIALAASLDGTSLATGSQNGAIHLWDLKTGLPSLVGQLESKLDIGALTFLPDGSLVSASDDKTVRLWRFNPNQQTTLHQHQSWANNVTASKEGRYLASVGQDGTVWVTELKTGQQQVLKGHTKDVWGVSFSPDGQWLATASSSDKTVKLWELSSGQAKTLEVGFFGLRVAFSPDGKKLAISGQSPAVELWDVATQKKERSFIKHKESITDIAFSPNGKVLASSATSGDSSIELWDLQSGESRPIKTSAKPVRLAFLPSGKELAFTNTDGTIHLVKDDLPLDATGLSSWLWTFKKTAP